MRHDSIAQPTTPNGLGDIVITEALSRRASHQTDRLAEAEAFCTLARQTAQEPDSLLKTLANTALRLCQAGTAGIGLLETTDTGEEVVRWMAVAGAFAAYEGGTTPLEISLDRICVERQAAQLYSYPARQFTYLNSPHSPFVEALFIPFGVERPILGTLWVVSHDQVRRFDAEDVRLLTGLAEFTATALRLIAVAQENAKLCQDAQNASLSKDDFLATLAHELRNPLAPVRNAVEILRLKGPPLPELVWARDVIDRQVQQMTRLIDDLLDINRIACNKLDLHKEQVSLETIVQGAVETSRPFIEQHGQELTVTLPAELIFLQADLTRLAQVFSNLLNNAAKFTESGGHIWLTAERHGSDVVVAVKDSGMGISSHMLPQIFEMYKQANRARDRSEGGLGIGLALVKRLVEMHDGSIEARSDGHGQGSEFIVRLPIDLSSHQPQWNGDDRQMPVPTSHFRVLVVDDNRDAADCLGMMLRITGNEPRIVYDGLDAVAAAAEFRPDVALLDIGLPKLNGFEAAQRIREQPWGKRIVLIALTGWGQEEDKRHSKEAGFDAHLVKPVEPIALMKLLAGLQLSASE